MFIRPKKSFWRPVAKPAVVGLGAGFLEYIVHTMLMSAHFSPAQFAALDAVIVGIVTAIAAYVVLAWVRARHRKFEESLFSPRKMSGSSFSQQEHDDPEGRYYPL